MCGYIVLLFFSHVSRISESIKEPPLFVSSSHFTMHVVLLHRLHCVVTQPGGHLSPAWVQPQSPGGVRREHRLWPGPVGVHRGRPRPQSSQGGVPGLGPRLASLHRQQRGPERTHSALPPWDAEFQRGHVDANALSNPVLGVLSLNGPFSFYVLFFSFSFIAFWFCLFL